MKCKDVGYVKNCIIKRRKDDKSNYLFFADGDKGVIAFLDGYAIIPVEEYNRMRTDRNIVL